MLVSQGSVVPPREIVPVLGMFAEVVPELVIAERLVVTFGEGVGQAQCRKSADESDPITTDNDSCRVVAVIVWMLQNERVGPCAANTKVHDNGVIVRGAWSTFRKIPRHDVTVDSAG